MITPSQQADAGALIALCQQRDGIDPTVYSPNPDAEISPFLRYEDRRLAGLFTVANYSGSVEVVGLVHPDFRRRGIGRALMDAVRSECRRRGAATLLLVSEAAAPAGSAFAEALGGRRIFSEHRMLLNPEAFRRAAPVPGTLTLRRVLADETETLVRLQSRSFGSPEEDSRTQMTAWLAAPGQRFYVGAQDGQPVGMIRVDPVLPDAYLNTFGVLPEFRNRGLGRQLLRGVVGDLLAESERILIEVETENDNALHLYQSCGFASTTTFHYHEIAL